MIHKNISEKDNAGFVVRIIRHGVEHSEYFSNNLWGSRDNSLNAAIEWRDRLLSVLGARKSIKSCKNTKQTSTGISGVSRTVKFDSRRNKNSLCYMVFWVKSGKHMNKTFNVGDIEKITSSDDFHAFRIAKLFRSCYEFAIDHGLEFDDSKFMGWKQARLYDDSEFNAVI